MRTVMAAAGIFLLSACGGNADDLCSQGNGLRPGGYTGASLASGTYSLVIETGDGLTGASVRFIGEKLTAVGVSSVFFVPGRTYRAGKNLARDLTLLGHVPGNAGFAPGPLDQSADPVEEVRLADLEIAGHVPGGVFLLGGLPTGGHAKLLQRLGASGFGRYTGPLNADFSATAALLCMDQGAAVADCLPPLLAATRAAGRGVVGFPVRYDTDLAMMDELVSRMTADGAAFVRPDLIPEVADAIRDADGEPGSVSADGCRVRRD